MYKVIFALIILNSSSYAIASSDQQTDSAYSWLELIDSGSYEESWSFTASLFQEKVSSSQWVQVLTQTRNLLGEVLSREINSVTEANTLPGAPIGEYMVFSFSSSYENVSSAAETLVLIKENEEWRPASYKMEKPLNFDSKKRD